MSSLLAYRAGFYSHLMGSMVWGVFHYISIYLLTFRIQSVYGWSKPELFLLTASFGVMWGLFRLLFIKTFHDFAGVILGGRLDGILIKPVDSQFLMSVWRVAYDESLRVILGIGFTIYTIHAYQLPISLVSVLLYIFLMMFAILASYSIWFISSTITFWSPRLDNMIGLLFSLAGLMRYPSNVMQRFGETFVLFITPLIFVITPATRALIGKATLPEMIWLVGCACLLFLVSRKFWHYALRSYTSMNN